MLRLLFRRPYKPAAVLGTRPRVSARHGVSVRTASVAAGASWAGLRPEGRTRVDQPELEPSAVPSDGDPWPGDTPFTTWGQHGMGQLDLRVLDQGDWWVDHDEQPHRLVEMSDDYLLNVEPLLIEHRDYFYRSPRLRWRIQGGRGPLPGAPLERDHRTNLGSPRRRGPGCTRMAERDTADAGSPHRSATTRTLNRALNLLRAT